MTSVAVLGALEPGVVGAQLLRPDPARDVDALLIADIEEAFAEALEPWRWPPRTMIVATGTGGPGPIGAPVDLRAQPTGAAPRRALDATQRSPPRP